MSNFAFQYFFQYIAMSVDLQLYTAGTVLLNKRCVATCGVNRTAMNGVCMESDGKKGKFAITLYRPNKTPTRIVWLNTFTEAIDAR